MKQNAAGFRRVLHLDAETAGGDLSPPAARALVLAAISGSAAVAVVGMSLVFATGALSVTPLGREALSAGVVAAFVSATLGAFCVALMARVPGEVCGPRASIAVTYAVLCADLMNRAGPQASFGEVWAALSVAVVLMGVLQALAGFTQLGDAIKFMPYPVSVGFVTGIGLLIVWSQVGPSLGLEGRLAQYHWSDVLAQLKAGALLVAAVTSATVWLLPKLTSRGQPLLVALAIGTMLHHTLVYFMGHGHLGPTFGTIAPIAVAGANISTLWHTAQPEWLLSTALHVLPYAAFLALQGIMNAAVSSVIIAEITEVRSNINRTLIAQGFGNILCGALAALPIGTSPSQSTAAAKMKNVNAIVPAASCLILLIAFLVIGDMLSPIPIAVLAGILVTVGAGMIDRWARGLAQHVIRAGSQDTHVTGNLVIVAAVAAAFVFGGVPVALLVGAVLAMILLTINLSAVTSFASHDAARIRSTRVWSREQAQWIADRSNTITIFRPRGGLFFGTADQLATRLAALDADTSYCVVDLSRVTTLDATGCQILASGARKLSAAGIITMLAGLDASHPREKALIALGLKDPDPNTLWFEDLDHALEFIELRLVEERWPDVMSDAPVVIADTPLGKGLSEVEELKACMESIEVQAGPLFSRGDPGAAMYLIDEGFVEMRVGDGSSGKTTRLAAFGPGSIFGEIAMLTSNKRTADAVCLTRSRLYELRRDALSALETRSPQLYARIMATSTIIWRTGSSSRPGSWKRSGDILQYSARAGT